MKWDDGTVGSYTFDPWAFLHEPMPAPPPRVTHTCQECGLLVGMAPGCMSLCPGCNLNLFDQRNDKDGKQYCDQYFPGFVARKAFDMRMGWVA